MDASLNANSVGQLAAATKPAATVDPDLTVHTTVTVPISGTLSPEAKQLLKEDVAKGGLSVDLHGGINEIRAAIDNQVAKPNLASWRSLYEVDIQPEVIAGVQTDVVTPRVGGVSKDRVLINLHGGGFMMGARFGGQVESVPMAGIGHIKVITVDYREAPEHRFPTGSEDVAAVYKELLKTYQAKNIGIYGCSAGGFLTAEVVAWFQTHNLPKPGAIGIFCAGGLPISTPTDSNRIWQSLSLLGAGGAMSPGDVPLVYFKDVANDDALAWPATSPAVLSKFPPTLVMASTRDPLMGNAILTHTRLIKAGVDAQLYIQEGLGHAFMASMPKTPEAIDAYTAAWKFFDTHLGR